MIAKLTRPASALICAAALLLGLTSAAHADADRPGGRPEPGDRRALLDQRDDHRHRLGRPRRRRSLADQQHALHRRRLPHVRCDRADEPRRHRRTWSSPTCQTESTTCGCGWRTPTTTRTRPPRSRSPSTSTPRRRRSAPTAASTTTPARSASRSLTRSRAWTPTRSTPRPPTPTAATTKTQTPRSTTARSSSTCPTTRQRQPMDVRGQRRRPRRQRGHHLVQQSPCQPAGGSGGGSPGGSGGSGGSTVPVSKGRLTVAVKGHNRPRACADQR